MGTVFLLTDAQVPDEKFLVLINDLLASGEIPDLFAGKLDQKKSFSEPLNTPLPPPWLSMYTYSHVQYQP